MKKLKLKKGFLKKNYTVEIPEEFVEKCEVENNELIGLARFNKSFLLLSNNEDLLNKKREAIDTIFSGDDCIPITLHRGKNSIIYKDILGFFEFRGELYYRAKGVAGRHLKSDMPFSAKIKELYPDDFKDTTAAEISNLEVTPLYLL